MNKPLSLAERVEAARQHYNNLVAATNPARRSYKQQREVMAAHEEWEMLKWSLERKADWARMETQMNIADLNKPFSPEQISWRVGSTTKDKSKGMALAYIDARDVQDRLDQVCGPAGWQCRYPHAHDKKTVCEIGIKVGDEWIWKADGAGDTDVEGEKGALSDAFKRAAVRWGIGRYLYDVESPWVALEAAGNSYKIAASAKAQLFAALRGKQAAPHATPTTASTPSIPNSPPVTANNTEAKSPAQAAADWVAKQMEAIAAFKTAKELAAWEREKEKTILDVAKKNPTAHRQLLDYVMAQYDTLNPMAAQ